MKAKNNFSKYAIIVLVVIFVITAALLLLEVWEKNQGRYTGSVLEDDILEYEDKEYVLKDNIETFLVLGLDKFDGATSADSHESGVQNDFLMLFVLDNEAKQCEALHINRDTMTNINRLGIDGTKIDSFTKQIALAYNYAADGNDKVRCGNAKDSVEMLLQGIDIDHYLSLTMDAVPAMNDLVGGVELTVLDDFTGIDDTLIKGEKVTLMGEQALRYVRTRYGLDDSTNSTRMKRQQQYINALYEKTISRIESDEEFVAELVKTMDDYIVYDSSDHKMKKLAEKFDDYEFLGIRKLEGETKMGEEFIEFYPDEDSIWETVIDLFYTEKSN
ncbi:MAG: LCP family protein [Clostridia bacterium]|nr:LCP family protein [Clostridia bacterium]